MAFTTPRTYVAGEIHTAAHHNTYERDNIAWIATDSPACRAFNSANISVTTSAVEQALTLNSERFDNAAVHSTSTNTSRFTVPTGGGGKYIATGSITWAANGSGTYRACSLRHNATTRIGQINAAPSASHGSDATVVAIYALAAADYVEMAATQDSGGALNVNVQANYSPEASVFWFRT